VLSSFTNVASSAAVKGNQVFGPYGKARYVKGTINTAKGFTGQYNDSLTGLDYYNARYYDPVAGVFLSADPVRGNGSGDNPYAYVGGNPETKNDPTGLAGCLPGEFCLIGGKPTTLSGCDLSSCSGPPPPSTLVASLGGFGTAVGASSNAAVGYPPTCLVVGCEALLRAKVGFQATVKHRINVNMPTIACTGFCFITLGEEQLIGTTTVHGVTEAPFVHCGLSFYDCSLENALYGGDTGGGGHDMPDVAPADTGGGAAGNPAGESGVPEGETPLIPSGELPQQADLAAKGLVNDVIPNAFGRSRTTIGVAFVQDSEGSITRLVSMNSNSMQRWGSQVLNNLSPADVWVPSQGAGLHAEQNLV
jgi:RHS repeat-associated protein